MAKFLNTDLLNEWILRLIEETERELIIIVPYIKTSGRVYKQLFEANKRGVETTIVYRENKLTPEEKRKFEALDNLNLMHHPNVHAKCYYNEKYMIIGSVNLYEYSEKNNREMGVLISKLNDGDLYKKAYNEALSIKNNSEFIALKHEKSQYVKQEKKEEKGKVTYQTKISTLPTRGYCIRCGKRLKFNPNYPFCESCYSTWAFWGNEEFSENQCHGCGEYTDTSMAKPLCLDCFKIHVNSNPKF